MEEHTFRSRINELVQKSRKAVRLYSGVSKLQTENGTEHTDSQISEWRRVNTELLNELGHALENPHPKNLARDVFTLRDRFYFEWTDAESKLQTKQAGLISAAQNGDFVKAAVLSQELVVLKSRAQATQAVHHEIAELIRRSKVSAPPIELTREHRIQIEEPKPELARVIPFRMVKNY